MSTNDDHCICSGAIFTCNSVAGERGPLTPGGLDLAWLDGLGLLATASYLPKYVISRLTVVGWRFSSPPGRASGIENQRC